MAFYQSIAAYYNEIFPFSAELKQFIDIFPVKADDRILDIGSATGELAVYLAKKAGMVIGLELDPEMIGIAAAKVNRRQLTNVRFYGGNMNELDRDFGGKQFDYIFCLGNTLVHLLSIREINRFFENAYSILSPQGKLIFQILNYERILKQQLYELPLIENNRLKFERKYRFDLKQSLIYFQTKLFLKDETRMISNEIPLLPLRYHDIITFIGIDNFKEQVYYGDFKLSTYQPDSDLLIGVLRK